MLHDALVESVKLFRFEGRVHCSPGDGVGRGLIFYDELVFGRAPSAIGIADQGSVGRQLRFVAPDGVLHQQCRRKIEVGPAFTQQLGYVADVHCGRHRVSWGKGACKTANTPFSLKRRRSAKYLLVRKILHTAEKQWGPARVRQISRKSCSRRPCGSPRNTSSRRRKCGCRPPPGKGSSIYRNHTTLRAYRIGNNDIWRGWFQCSCDQFSAPRERGKMTFVIAEA